MPLMIHSQGRERKCLFCLSNAEWKCLFCLSNAEVEFVTSASVKHPPFSILCQKFRHSRVSWRIIQNFWNLVGVKYLTNSTCDEMLSINAGKISNLFWNVGAIAGGTLKKFRREAAFGGMDTWLPRVKKFFTSDIFAKSRKYFYLILEFSSNCRTRSGGGERLRTAFWGRFGGLEGHLTSKERKCFFLRYHVNIFTLF